MSNIKDTTLTEIVNVGYKSYAMYVLESRAIPSVVDGFKPVQRKLLYAMLNWFDGRKVKLTDLAGISRCVSSDTLVHINGKMMTILEAYDNYVDGDTIETYNESNNRFEKCKMLGIYKKQKADELVSIHLEDGSTLNVTPEHEVLLSNGLWVEARHLTEEDDIMQM